MDSWQSKLIKNWIAQDPEGRKLEGDVAALRNAIRYYPKDSPEWKATKRKLEDAEEMLDRHHQMRRDSSNCTHEGPLCDCRMDAIESAMDDLGRRLDAVEHRGDGRSVRDDFTGYVVKRVGGYDIIEGAGPDGGYFLARARPRAGTGGTTRKFDNLQDAIRHAEMEQPGRYDAAETRADPPVSEEQRRAMRAAAAGNSNLGIPKSVGEEFSEADPGGKLPEKESGGHLLK